MENFLPEDFRQIHTRKLDKKAKLGGSENTKWKDNGAQDDEHWHEFLNQKARGFQKVI